MGRLGWNSGYIGSDQRDTAVGAVSYSKYYLERTDGRFLPVLDRDPDAQAFFDRVVAAGGTLSSIEQIAINQLVLDMKTYGIWNLMKAIYPMVGASAAACAQNLKSSSFTGTFTSGWTFASTGITGNGTSAYMNTGLAPNGNLSQNNTSVRWYSRTSGGVGTDLGVSDAGLGNGIWSYNSSYIAVNSSYLSFIATTSNAGLFSMNRQSLTNAKFFQNGSLYYNASLISTGLSSYNIYLEARNTGGSIENFSNRQLAYADICDSISDAQELILYNIVQAFQTTLSRQV